VNRDQQPGGRRLLLGDVIILIRLIDVWRQKALERVFGAQRDQSLLITVIAAGAVAEGVHSAASRAKQATTTPPSLGDSFIAATVVKEGMNSVIGVKSTDRPFVGTLIAAAVLTKLLRPVVSENLHRMRARTHRSLTALRRRYGV
jgi:hypothetical protein